MALISNILPGTRIGIQKYRRHIRGVQCEIHGGSEEKKKRKVSFRSAIRRRKYALVAAAQLRPAPIVGKTDAIRVAVGGFKAFQWIIRVADQCYRYVGTPAIICFAAAICHPKKPKNQKKKVTKNLPAQYQLSSPSEVMSVFQKLQQTISGASSSR